MGKIIQIILGALGKLLGQSLVYTTFAIALVGVIFTSMWVFGDDLFMFIADKVFVFIGSMLSDNKVDTADYDFMYYIRQMPSEVRDLFVLMKLSYCLKIILTALTARFLLNLIPFVRI